MNEQPSWAPQRPFSLPNHSTWQRQGSSLLSRQSEIKGLPYESHMAFEPITGKIVADLNPAKIQEVAASQLVIVDTHYKAIWLQAQHIFRWALVITGVGVIFFLVAAAMFIIHAQPNASLICLISGIVVEVVAIVNFLLYGRTLGQLEDFHKRLDKTQQYLLANSICENLHGDPKQLTQTELVRAIMNPGALGEEKTYEDRGRRK